MNDKTGGPAFPSEGGHKFVSGNEIRKTLPSSGMTLRDYFAAQAMQAYLSRADALARPRRVSIRSSRCHAGSARPITPCRSRSGVTEDELLPSACRVSVAGKNTRFSALGWQRTAVKTSFPL